MSTEPFLRYWLVRTPQNAILRPMSEQDLFEKMSQGELGNYTEVCLQDSYWFFLHETAEVQKHFGTELFLKNKTLGGVRIEDETTETQVEHNPFKVEVRGQAEPIVPIENVWVGKRALFFALVVFGLLFIGLLSFVFKHY